jgi:hypothetical protein
MFNPSRDQVRQFFRQAWQKHRERQPLIGAEASVIDLILRHPEYHSVLESPTAISEEYSPERGETNPFLHLSLHLAIVEQLSIDQPPGIRAAFEKLAARTDRHAAEHIRLDALGTAIFDAQTSGRPLDPAAYVDAVQRAASRDGKS